MKKLAVLAVAGFVSVTASASNWVLITSDPDSGVSIYVDANSISHSGYYKKSFLKLAYSDIQTSSFGPFNSQIALQNFNCESQPKEYQYLSITAYLNGQVVSSEKGSYSWHIVYPDSIVSNMANFICSY